MVTVSDSGLIITGAPSIAVNQAMWKCHLTSSPCQLLIYHIWSQTKVRHQTLSYPCQLILIVLVHYWNSSYWSLIGPNGSIVSTKITAVALCPCLSLAKRWILPLLCLFWIDSLTASIKFLVHFSQCLCLRIWLLTNYFAAYLLLVDLMDDFHRIRYTECHI